MLPKQHRLSLRTELNRIKGKGNLFQGHLFSLLIDRYPGQPSRFGFIISSKVHKKAVKRNRAKRLLSESIFSLLPRIKPGFSLVFLAKRKVIGDDFKEIESEIEELFIKTGIIDS